MNNLSESIRDNWNLNEVKAIFFDAGGTLIHLDSNYICLSIKESLGIHLAADRFRHAQFLGMSRVAQLVAEGAGSTEQLKREFYSTLLPEVGVARDALEATVECVLRLAYSEMLWRTADETTASALNRLKARGLKLAIVSNSDGRIEYAFQQAALTEPFDFFIDSFKVGVEKPDPRIFLMATERAGVDPNEAAYVGDLYAVDVVGARKAGLIPILYDPFELNADADCCRIKSIDELLMIFSE
jgi:putative hydrolase of the HAD superfamily